METYLFRGKELPWDGLLGPSPVKSEDVSSDLHKSSLRGSWCCWEESWNTFTSLRHLCGHGLPSPESSHIIFRIAHLWGQLVQLRSGLQVVPRFAYWAVAVCLGQQPQLQAAFCLLIRGCCLAFLRVWAWTWYTLRLRCHNLVQVRLHGNFKHLWCHFSVGACGGLGE